MLVFEKVPESPRLVNHFTLGADPEFGFRDNLGRYVHAETFGMNTLQAFGCDMCGRVAELRAYPSRFALDVVASMIDALRWIPLAHPVGDVVWEAVSYIENDGCGGHLHFGRKRCVRKDTEILDDTLRLLLGVGTLSAPDFQVRAKVTKYGKYGDVRPQGHGYEYRTMPTWLSSPWLAYLVLVINKLIVHQGRPSAWNPKSPKDAVEELLMQFRTMDDDAAIAYEAYKRYGLPKQDPSDFKGRWGVQRVAQRYPISKFFFPTVMQPEGKTREELFLHLTQGAAIPARVPVPTWAPFELPKGFYRPVVQAHTLGHLPDTGMNLISRVPLSISMTREFKIISGAVELPILRIKRALANSMPPEDVHYEPVPGGLPAIYVQVPPAFKDSQSQCRLLRKLLADTTLFPACDYKDFAKVDWGRWDNAKEAPKVKVVGRKLQ